MLYVITGHYGSGKTEFALNFAISKKMSMIVDLDIVNPYFRTADVKDKLDDIGIRAITPNFAGSNIDVPSLPAEIYSAFQQDGDVLFDVGGDDDGAIALGRFNKSFLERGYEMFFVVNTRRPGSKSPEQIIEMVHAVEGASRLKVTGLINNTNIMKETRPEHIAAGHEIISRAAETLKLPIVYNSAMEGLANGLPNCFNMKKYINVPWEV